MMRIGFLPSDFNPMILMLGEAEDCRALGGVLRRFARDGADVTFSDLRFCRLVGTDLRLTAAAGPTGIEHHKTEPPSSGGYRLTPPPASLNDWTTSQNQRGSPDRKTWTAAPKRASR